MKLTNFYLLFLNFLGLHPEFYEVIPDEIVYPKKQEIIHSPYIFNTEKFKYDLEKQRISKEQESFTHNGKLYYKQPEAYYGPETTYNEIPNSLDVKFETPVTIEEIDEPKNEKQLKEDLIELEMQLSNLLLFSSEPKYLNHNTVKDNYALPYYDTTYEDKIIRIKELKQKILKIRELLNIQNTEISFYVQVKNSTFPKKADDIAKHLKESFYRVEEGLNITSINGNFTSIDDMYKTRDIHLQNHFTKMNGTDIFKNFSNYFSQNDGHTEEKNIHLENFSMSKSNSKIQEQKVVYSDNQKGTLSLIKNDKESLHLSHTPPEFKINKNEPLKLDHPPLDHKNNNDKDSLSEYKPPVSNQVNKEKKQLNLPPSDDTNDDNSDNNNDDKEEENNKNTIENETKKQGNEESKKEKEEDDKEIDDINSLL